MPRRSDTVSVDFKPIAESKIGELAANFDIVMGVTPEDPKDKAAIKGGIGKSQMQGGHGGSAARRVHRLRTRSVRRQVRDGDRPLPQRIDQRQR